MKVNTLTALSVEGEVIVVRVNKPRALLMSAGSVCLMSLGIFALVDTMNPLFYFGAAFFAYCAVGWGSMVLPQSHLRLDSEGLSLRAGINRFTYRWQDVERFGLWGVGNGSVCFTLARQPGGLGLLKSLNRALSGFDGSIPDALALEPQELFSLLDEWHSRGAGSRKGSGRQSDAY